MKIFLSGSNFCSENCFIIGKYSDKFAKVVFRAF